MNHLEMPTDTVLLGVDNAANIAGIVQSTSGSPYLADEDAATCLLLPATPSPPPMDFIHPLTATGPNASDDCRVDDHGGDDGNGGLNGGVNGRADEAHGETSSSSGSSGIGTDVPIAGTTTLYNNKNVYQNLDNNGETFQQNGTKQYANLNIQITKDTPGFVHWNWPLIRQCSFYAFMAAVLAMATVVVAMIVALPRKCDPVTTWYNGGVFYEIFPASYQDSNGDGVGDLLGVANRVGYLQALGVSAVRLNSIFTAAHYPDDYRNISTLLQIAPVVGRHQDLGTLAGALHAHNMSLVLDLPIYPLVAQLDAIDEDASGDETDVGTDGGALNSSNGGIGDRVAPSDDSGGSVAAARARRSTTTLALGLVGDHSSNSRASQVVQAMQLWMSLGVDGFYVHGLEHYRDDPHLLANVRHWKRLLGRDRVLIVGNALLDSITPAVSITTTSPPPEETIASAAAAATAAAAVALRDAIMRSVDLVDVAVDMRYGAQHIAAQIRDTVASGGALAAAAGRAQVHWSVSFGETSSAGDGDGAVGEEQRRRIASVRSPNATLAATMMALVLPGTPSILYGDEIGLRDAHDPHGDHADTRRLHHLAPMAWSTDKQFTGRQTLPWLPRGEGAVAFAHSEAVSGLIALRRRSPTLYQPAIGRGKGAVQANTAVRHSRSDVLVVERWYPRRQSFVAITNFGAKTVRLDLSSLFYGGVVMAGGDGSGGAGSDERVLFRDFAIHAEQTVVVMLDK